MPGAPRKRLLRRGCPAEGERNCGLIEFALDGIDGAALVEAENLVTEVQAGSLEAKALGDAIATLDVILRVGVEIDVARRTFDSEDWISVRRGVGVGVVVERYVGIIVAHGEAHGEAALVVGNAGIPSIRCLAWQRRVIESSLTARACRIEEGRKRHGRLCVAVVRGYAESV